MDRKDFIKICGLSCMGLVGLSAIMESCTTVKYINATKENDLLKVSRSEFIKVKDDKIKYSRYIIVKTSAINFPIALYRFSDNDFAALLLQCPHQGMELNVNGDLIVCSAHGSEFNNKGEVSQGPADQNLKQYKTTADTNNIYIHLS